MPSLFTIVGAAALLLPEAVLGAVTPNHPAVANHALAPNFGCNILGVSEYFAEQYPVPQQCQDHYSVQVRDLCREYLNLIRTVYTTTVTPVVTRTNSFTTRTTATVFTTSTSTAVITSVSTSVSTSLTTTTAVATTPGSFARRDREIAAAPPPGCSDITRDSFLSHPAFMIEVACKCLPIRFTTISTASTARTTRTTTVSSTATLSFTITSPTTTTTSTTTITTTTSTTSSTSTETFTVPTNNCDVQFEYRGEFMAGDGNSVSTVTIDGSEDPADCCRICNVRDNCVAVQYVESNIDVTCTFLINDQDRDTPARSDQCYNGYEDFDFGPTTDSNDGLGVFQGPCGY